MNVEVRPFRKSDLDEMEFRDIESDFFNLVGGSEGFVDSLNLRGDCWTLEVDGKIVVFGGLVVKWEGVADVWMIPDKLGREYSIQMAKKVKWVIDKMFESYNLYRLQTICIDDKIHSRFMKFLGFEQEGLLKMAAPGKKDYCIFGRIENGS